MTIFRSLIFTVAGTCFCGFAATQQNLSFTNNGTSTDQRPAGSPVDLKHYVVDLHTPIAMIDSQAAFDKLTDSQKRFVHHFSRASSVGGIIDFFQSSVESPYIFLILQQLFRMENVQDVATKKCDFAVADWNSLLYYAAGFYSNYGNYETYGMKKIIPALSQEKMICLLDSVSHLSLPSTMSPISLWNSVMVKRPENPNPESLMFSLSDRYRQQALKPVGITTYLSANCDENDARIIQEYMTSKGIEGWNNRAFKRANSDVSALYEIQFASSVVTNETLDGLTLGHVENFNGSSFVLTRGGFAEILTRVNQELLNAQNFVDNELEKGAILDYVASFTTGSVNSHKNGSRKWVQNKMPDVESYIGFIETYQDPSGQRGSFEAFVAAVDKDKSARLTKLVNNAEKLLPLLPWPRTLEKDHFMKPDFTDLSVIAYANGGIPLGINIPNYGEVRQVDGYKNVNLGNVVSASYASKKMRYLPPADAALLKQNIFLTIDIIVGLHELLGHGSGKLLMEFPNGTLNFGQATIGQIPGYGPANSWYKPGQTYETVFGKLASTLEECRAETVATYLSLFSDVLAIWNLQGADADLFRYLVWLNEAKDGLIALAEYKPATDTWGEAHARGHFAILRVMQAAGVADIQVITAEDGKPDMLVTLDRSKIATSGKAAMGNFLLGLEYYRSTANVTGAQALYDKYTSMTGPDRDILQQWARIALDRKQPRTIYIMPSTTIGNQGNRSDVVALKNYDSSAAGMVQSFNDIYNDAKLEGDIFAIAEREKHLFI